MEAIETVLDLGLLARIQERRLENILFDLTLHTSPGGASISGYNLFNVHVGFRDHEGEMVNGWPTDQEVDVSDVDQSLIAGGALTFYNRQAANLPLQNFICPEVSTTGIIKFCKPLTSASLERRSLHCVWRKFIHKSYPSNSRSR